MNSRGKPIGVRLAGILAIALTSATPAASQAQSEADKAPELIAALRELMTEHEIEHYLPDEPVRFIFEMWSKDAKSDRLVEHPRVVTVTTHGRYAHLHRSSTLHRDGDVKVSATTQAVGPEGAWKVRRTSATIEDSDGQLAEQTRKSVSFELLMLSRAFRQGLMHTKGGVWKVESLDITGDAWTAVLSSPDVKHPFKIEGRGLTRESLAIDRISSSMSGALDRDSWYVYALAGDHVPSPWSPRMFSKRSSSFDHTGSEVNRVVLREMAVVPREDFLIALRPPEPEHPPAGVTEIDDSRRFVAKTYEKDWSKPDEAAAPLALAESRYQVGRLVLIGSGIGAAVVGGAAAFVVVRRLRASS